MSAAATPLYQAEPDVAAEVLRACRDDLIDARMRFLAEQFPHFAKLFDEFVSFADADQTALAKRMKEAVMRLRERATEQVAPASSATGGETRTYDYPFPRDALLPLTDEAGIERACSIDFICREYGRTLVRENHHVWIGEKYASELVQMAPTPTHYIQQNTNDPSYPPEPEPGGRFRDKGNHFSFTVYFDDLVLHRATGKFHIRHAADHPFGNRTDVQAMENMQRRRHVPEFYIE